MPGSHPEDLNIDLTGGVLATPSARTPAGWSISQPAPDVHGTAIHLGYTLFLEVSFRVFAPRKPPFGSQPRTLLASFFPDDCRLCGALRPTPGPSV